MAERGMTSAVAFLGLSLTRITLRHWRRSPWTHAVMVLIVALGVGSFYSVRLSSRAAAAGFDLFADALTGGSDFLVEAPAGSLSDAWLPDMRHALGSLPVQILPVLETTVAVFEAGGQRYDMQAPTIRVLGIDLLASQNVLAYRDGKPGATVGFQGPGNEVALGDVALVYASARAGTSLGLAGGDAIKVIVNDQIHQLQVQAILPEGGPEATGLYFVMDLPALQTLTERGGELDRVEFVVPSSRRNGDWPEQAMARLEKAAEGRWVVTTPQAEQASTRTMTAAFRFNLTILSGLALLVGLFLILQALEANVLRRRSEIGVLRMLGAERSWLLKAWLFEALAIGLAGSVVGLALGYLAAQFTVGGVAGTVSVFYHRTTVSAASWHHGEALLAGMIGVVASLITGWLPARDAADTPPAHAFRHAGAASGIRLLDHPLIGVALLVAGAGLARLPALAVADGTRYPVAGYLAAVCFLIGAGILCSAALPWLERLGRRSASHHAVTRYTMSQFRQPSGRHKLTVAGLVLAVGMAAGMVLLIHSFRTTMWTWIDQTLAADVFIAPKGQQTASSGQRIRESTWRALAARPSVAFAELQHVFPVTVDGRDTILAGRTHIPERRPVARSWVVAPSRAMDLATPAPDGAWPALVSESFRYRFDLGKGDELTIPTPTGRVPLRIAGVFADYGNERGRLEVDGAALRDWFQDGSAVTCSLLLREDTPLAPTLAELRATYPGLSIRSQGLLREEIHKLFRETFSVTVVLQAIGVTVAVAGLALAMVSLMLERRRELAVLRELGMTRRGIAAGAALEGSLTALLGLGGGLVLSLVLGWILIFVINRQSFGWTLSYAVAWDTLALLGAGVLLAGVVASWTVGWWGATLKSDQEEE